MDIKEKIKTIPNSPGVYFFKDAGGNVIYIGKASQLRKRINSHFAKPRVSFKEESLISLTAAIDYTLTASEEEALLYEANLIKKYKPKFNVMFRDDKAYPLLKLTTGEEYPRLFITRKKKDDNALYFGPFTNTKLLKKALVLIRKIFPLCTCKVMPKTACLNYHLKQCLAPCIGKIDKDTYRRTVEDLISFLGGDKKSLLSCLNKRMSEYSANQEFEKALVIREQISALTSLTTPQAETREALEALKDLLNLRDVPQRIEAFDISNYAGKEAVGSLVVFLGGKAYKAGYRRFKIKFVKGIDDYAMMREVIKRRFGRLLEEKQKKPDLLLIDGGRGHFSAAADELKKMGLVGMKIAAIAKENEELYIDDKKEPIELFKFHRVLFLIQRVRDEAHRFAITYHYKLRSKQARVSILDGIPGIGDEKKRLLLQTFGSINGIKNAGFSMLVKVQGINEKLAKTIIEYLKR
ncbi:MAG: excinuclease ABC subunit UvrC [Candidatus Omnitrophota bacterium]